MPQQVYPVDDQFLHEGGAQLTQGGLVTGPGRRMQRARKARQVAQDDSEPERAPVEMPSRLGSATALRSHSSRQTRAPTPAPSAYVDVPGGNHNQLREIRPFDQRRHHAREARATGQG